MATLLDGVSSDTTGTGASHTAPATVFVRGTMDGARVVIQVSDDDTTYVKADNISLQNPCVFNGITGCCNIDGNGTYYIRAVLENAGSSTSVTVETTS